MHVETRLFYVFPKYLSVARNGFLTRPGPERKPQKKKTDSQYRSSRKTRRLLFDHLYEQHILIQNYNHNHYM